MPREGHDVTQANVFAVMMDISIHVPREGHDTSTNGARSKKQRFQSTCPARGTTLQRAVFQRLYRISIHVPREGHDATKSNTTSVALYFNPRAPRGARLAGGYKLKGSLWISIHVPREGHDFYHPFKSAPHVSRISIHVPREGHDSTVFLYNFERPAFQSTCPARGTTSQARCRVP